MSEDESKKPLLAEVKKLRRRVADLEAGKTKRIRAEEALRQSEEYSSTILNHSPYPILVINPDRSIRYVNPALEQLTGFSLFELVGRKTPYPWWTKETPEKNKRDFDTAFRHGARAKEELFKKKSGERFWVEITMTPIMTNGAFKYHLASWVDITERKKAEQRIKDSEQKYISAEKIGNFGHFSRYLDTDRLVWSAGTYYIFGVDPNQWELTRENAYKMVHPQDREKHRRDIEEAVRGAKGLDTEFRIIRPSGEERVIHTIADVTFDDAGKPERLFGTIQDITERKRAEEALRESEERYRALLELGGRIGEAVVMLQDDEHGVAMHVYASDEWARITGYSNDELLNMSMTELIHPRDLKEATKRYEKRIHGEVLPGFYEITIIRKDESEVPVEVTYAYSSYKGKPVNVGYIRDISERKKMEEQLVVTDRLASIGELASGVAHELNNPLTGIIGFSELLLKKNIAEEIKEDLEVINREAQRTAQIVRNLLTFARRHETTKEPVDINQAIQSVLDLRAYEQKVHNIEVVANFAPNLPKIAADLFRLQQVFVNIIINAEHFMTEAHGRGTLTITTESNGDIIRASFADDGPGIRKENIRHLFDPFFTTKEVGKGTGLGLSICHGIVTEHGGKIYAESKLKKGATFTLELPVKQKAETEV